MKFLKEHTIRDANIKFTKSTGNSSVVNEKLYQENDVKELLSKVKGNTNAISFVTKYVDSREDDNDIEIVLSEGDIKHFYDLDTIIRDRIIEGIEKYLSQNNVNKENQMSAINIKEELNKRDKESCKTDFVNMYEASNLSLDKKRKLAELLSRNVSNKAIERFLNESEEGWVCKGYAECNGNPPKSVEISFNDLCSYIGFDELDFDELHDNWESGDTDFVEDVVSNVVEDWLSDYYGYCHYGFDMDINWDEVKVIVTNISWDLGESMVESLSGKSDKDIVDMFTSILSLEEFHLVRYNDGIWGLSDEQGANLGGIEGESFNTISEVLDRTEIYHTDYIEEPLMDVFGIDSHDGYSDLVSKCREAMKANPDDKELQDAEWDLNALELIANCPSIEVCNKPFEELKDKFDLHYNQLSDEFDSVGSWVDDYR